MEGIKLNLKLDHIIHYLHQLESFKFPGEILELQSGGNIIIWAPLIK